MRFSSYPAGYNSAIECIDRTPQQAVWPSQSSRLCVVMYLSEKHLLLSVVEPPGVRLTERLQRLPIQAILAFLLCTPLHLGGTVHGVALGLPLHQVVLASPASDVVA